MLNMDEKLSTRDRIAWIDSFRGIAMICVVFGHINGFENAIGRFIYLFHVPVFFLLSGYLFNPNKKDCAAFIRAKFKSLLIPFLLFGLITIFADFALHLIKHESYDAIIQLKGMFFQIRGESNRIWFLPCLFLSELILYFSVKYKYCNFFLVAALIASWLNVLLFRVDFPWYPDTAVIGASIMLIGYKAKSTYKVLHLNRGLVFSLSLVVCGAVLVFNIKNGIYVDMVNNRYGFPAFFYVTSVAGAGILFCISNWILCKSLIYIGKNTISFLCLNSICIKIAGTIVNRIVLYVDLHINIIISLIKLLLTLGMLSIASYIINTFFPFLLGREYQKKKGSCQ